MGQSSHLRSDVPPHTPVRNWPAAQLVRHGAHLRFELTEQGTTSYSPGLHDEQTSQRVLLKREHEPAMYWPRGQDEVQLTQDGLVESEQTPSRNWPAEQLMLQGAVGALTQTVSLLTVHGWSTTSPAAHFLHSLHTGLEVPLHAPERKNPSLQVFVHEAQLGVLFAEHVPLI